MDLFYDILFRCTPCPEIYEILLSDFKVENLKNKLVYIIIDEVGNDDDINYYLEPILYQIYSKIGMDQGFIDELFLKSYNFSENMTKILVEYGANYEKYGKKAIKEAKKINNTEIINYIKNLLENSDE
ncbi:hypothetical protein H012_gp045 [Acanthamoeba polyphaga moumouvirus]|uniref:Ankyrin repeat protein n=1 Tax=Acanthamoeba polyphaga moumouvirus TaxID=1269028 RepID=L7RE47_9VIRU|nr:hypothetical protein H012_gp045 [Acanthamoeba polyphaga moumouvirus]AGC02403.1 hypothetical protein Moumou_00888 [Acanthamoeba polyphaga moumouvirus]